MQQIFAMYYFKKRVKNLASMCEVRDNNRNKSMKVEHVQFFHN